MGGQRSTIEDDAEQAPPRPRRRSAILALLLGVWAGVARSAAAGVGRWAVRSRARLIATAMAALLALWLAVGLVAPMALISLSVRPDERHQPAVVVVHNWSPLGLETGPASTWVERYDDGRWERLPTSALAYGVSLPPLIGRWETSVPGADALEPGRYRLVQEVTLVRRDDPLVGRRVTAGFEVVRPDGWERGVPPPGPEEGVWWLDV